MGIIGACGIKPAKHGDEREQLLDETPEKSSDQTISQNDDDTDINRINKIHEWFHSAPRQAILGVTTGATIFEKC